MFELLPYSLFLFGLAFFTYLIIQHAKKTGKVFAGLIYPPFDKEKMPEHYSIRVFLLYFLIVFCIVFGTIFLLIDVPDAPESKPAFTSTEFEEMLIGNNWTGESMYFDEEIKLTFHSDYTCQAKYNGATYNGHWQDDTDEHVNSIKFTWDEGQELQVPSPFADLEGFDKYVTITDAACHSGWGFMSDGGVMFTKSS